MFSQLIGQSQSNLLPDSIHTCKVDSLQLTLDTEIAFDSYLWSTGDTMASIWVYFTGDYSVMVTQGDTVTLYDTTFVNILESRIAQNDTTIDCTDTILLNTTSSVFDYVWADSLYYNIILDTLGTDDSILVSPRTTRFYYVDMYDPTFGFNHCRDSVEVTVESPIQADTFIQLKMECPDTVGARMQVELSGGFPPYQYNWSEGTPSYSDPSIVYKLTNGTKTLTVYDSLGCMLEEEFQVKAYPIPKISLFVEPDSVIYIQKPYANFSYENPTYDSLLVDSFSLSSWIWYMEKPFDSSSSTQSNFYTPSYTYKNPGKYNVDFRFITFYGCPGDTSIDLEVKPVKLKFPNVITPNDDGSNERFEITEDDGSGGGDGGDGGDLKSADNEPIDLSKYYISNKLTVFNRWGKKVFETDNYQNDWDGDNLQDGTYFFILICEGETDSPTYKGSITILRGS